jgi:two-component system phosphate regulon sensor histidine kinase PhoR
MSFWLPPLLRLLAIAVLGLLVSWVTNPTIGFAVTSLGFAALVVVQLRYLDQMRQWLKTPRPEDIPDGWGAWGDVFAEMYRTHRREEKGRARLAQALSRFEQAAEAIPDGVILLDVQNRIDWCNTTAASQFGIELAVDRGQVVTHLIRYPAFSDYLAQDPGTTEPVVLRTTGDTPLVLSIQVILFAEDEKLMLSRDITAIDRTETIRRDFIANVSHELRTPLTVINGYLEHLAEGVIDPRSATRPVAVMREQALRMTRLVEDLLTLSRLESDDNVLCEEDVDVAALVATLLEEGRTLSSNRHVLLADVASVHLRGSADELRSAFSNLVSNAVRYTPESGRITLRWIADGASLRFSVTDNGIGIPAEHLPRLAERFYRVDRSRSRETGGTGLGLAIVKHVLMRHRGHLEIASTPGEGSTFTCVFPLERAIFTAAEPARARASA